MKKTKKIIKKALKNPNLYTEAELLFMQMWRKEHERIKKIRESEKEVK